MNDIDTFMSEEDRFSISVFLTDVFQPQNRSTILPTDKILLVKNKARGKHDKKGRGAKPEGSGLPGGHGNPGEEYIKAAYRELWEETGINPQHEKKVYLQAELVENDYRMFLTQQGVDTESEPEKDENGNVVFKPYWHLTQGARLLVPAKEVFLAIGTEGIEMVGWYRFDQLPSGLYRSHKKRIRYFYERLSDEELFDHIFRQKS